MACSESLFKLFLLSEISLSPASSSFSCPYPSYSSAFTYSSPVIFFFFFSSLTTSDFFPPFAVYSPLLELASLDMLLSSSSLLLSPLEEPEELDEPEEDCEFESELLSLASLLEPAFDPAATLLFFELSTL